MVVLVIPCTVGRDYLLGILRGLKEFGKFNIIRSADKFLRLAVIIIVILVWRRLAVSYVVLIDMAAIAFVFTCIYVLIKPEGRKGKEESNFKEAFVSIHAYGGWAFLFFLTIALYGKIDRIIVAKFTDPTELGFYTIAVRTAEIIWIFIQSLQVVLLPRLAESEEEERLESMEFIFSLSPLILLFLTLFIGILGTICIPLLYGSRFAAAVAPFQVLIIGIAVYSLHKILATYYFSINRIKVVVLYSLIALVLNTGLSYFLVLKLGLIGAAMGTSITYTVVTVLLVWQFKRESGKLFRQLFMPRVENLRLLFSRLVNALYWKSKAV
jgi:O-antigen/teichoic acid export membrane protein